MQLCSKMENVVLFLVVLLFFEGLQLCFSKNSTYGCIERERDALLQLKQSFHGPSNRLVSWTGKDCCQWNGISCNQNSGHVIKLDLRIPSYPVMDRWGYSGSSLGTYIGSSSQLSVTEVNSCLLELTRLEYLDLSGNYFNQIQIPEFFGSLKHLRYLNLSMAGFAGRIPVQLGNLSSLQIIDLSADDSDDQQLYADNYQWISGLSSLKYLDMSSIDIGKALDLMQILNMLPSLIDLRLNNCGIQNIHFPRGSLNSTFLASVEFLGLEVNGLTTPIPNALQNMTALRELDLSYQRNLYSGELCHFDNLQWVSSLSSLQHLDMSSTNLSKALDLMKVLNTLPSLLELHLSGCGIQNIHLYRGFINSTFASIQFLDLAGNELSGPIPDALQNMTAIQTLDLSENFFDSTIPLLLVNSKRLVNLNLKSNQFENIEGGMLSLLNKACSLKSLDLFGNSFIGEVLESNKNSSTCLKYNLEYLDLQYSGISGNLPDYLGQLKGLKELYLAGNSLYGSIPSSLGELSMLRILHLSLNQLNGTIPESLGRLSMLKQLQLSHNQLNGIIPESLGRLSTLEHLDLEHNQLNGTIPVTLGTMLALERLDLSHNELTGSIPDSFGQLASLRELDVSSNSLRGIVSELNFAILLNLEGLDISSNHLSFNVKSDWIPPFSDLYYINMSSCEIGSQFPHWIQNLRNVGVLDFSNAKITGGFPVWLHPISLYYLDLSSNQISGNLPTNMESKMPKLRALLLRNNQVHGELPNSLCNLGSLEVMDLSGNKLSGEMPNCWREGQMLYVINLSHNKLSGIIPESIWNLSHLKWFHVDENNLTGELPLALRNCKELKLLDLGENNFSGSIPTWIGESLSSLEILRLRNNMLNGSIPSQLCRLSGLHILDLANNNLIGTIPHCFAKLPGMVAERPSAPPTLKQPLNLSSLVNKHTNWHREKVREVTKGVNLEYTKLQLELLDMIDLSSNKLVGVIPEELCVLSGLRGLNLSHNHLSGNIPNKIGELKLLESLDLSNNNLCGSIPPSMSALPSISHLNLSHNNLSGKIPTSNQLQTLIDPSIYIGNLELCGDPLPKCPGDDDSAKPPTSMAHEDEDHEEDKKEKILFYFVVLAGYATGLWGVIGTLVFKRNWRVAYFRFADNAKEWILVMVAVKVARLKQMIQRTSTEE